MARKRSLAELTAKKARKDLAEIEKRRKGWKPTRAATPDVIRSRPSGKGRESSLAEGGKDVLSAIGKIKKPKKKDWEDDTPSAADESAWDESAFDSPDGEEDETFIDDFGDTDYSGSDWDWDSPFKHGGRIKKAKKAKAESRKPRSRPAIRGRRRELKGS
tara:strand:- start:2969 stop:3448 length:480 start_codon:yes stop_codon:yes gene_type:complete